VAKNQQNRVCHHRLESWPVGMMLKSFFWGQKGPFKPLFNLSILNNHCEFDSPAGPTQCFIRGDASCHQKRVVEFGEWLCQNVIKDNRQEKAFDALDWLAAMASHIPDRREQMVRYYGFYSNASRRHRQKENTDGLIPCVIEPDEKARPNRNWERLIQKIGACPGPDPGRLIP
jgi:hypothetical protein